MTTSLRVITPTALKIRNYEITTKHPYKFFRVEIASDKKYFTLYYIYNNNEYNIKIETDEDEVEIAYCRISNDQYTILSDVKYQPHSRSQPSKMTVDFEKSFGSDLPHLKHGWGSPEVVFGSGSGSCRTKPPTHYNGSVSRCATQPREYQ